MKYWEQFAEMLGLELGQEFVITDSYTMYKGMEDGKEYTLEELGL